MRAITLLCSSSERSPSRRKDGRERWGGRLGLSSEFALCLADSALLRAAREEAEVQEEAEEGRR